MAWRCSGGSNDELVDNMWRNGVITDERVRDVMKRIDRANYAPHSPYADSPQSLGHAATISAPHMHASALCTLAPFLNPSSRALDIGSGSGYLTHALALLCQPGGRVVGVEHIRPLVEMGKENVGKSEEGRGLLESGGVEFVLGDGRLGWSGGDGKGKEEWDVVHVGAAAVEVHEALVKGLKRPGRLFMPVETDGVQHIWVIDKKEDGTVEKKKLYGVRYVPLTDAPSESGRGK